MAFERMYVDMDTTVAGFLEHLMAHFSSIVFIEARLSTAFALFFFLRREWVPAKLVIGMTFVLSLFILFYLPVSFSMEKMNLSEQVLILLQQVFLGFITALLINFFVEFFIGFGQIVSMQAGLGFVNFFIPKIGHISPMTQFFMLLATVVFFSINGHLVLIKMLIESIIVIPELPLHIDSSIFPDILEFSGILYKGSVMLSLAVVFSVMLSNMTLAVLTKFSPQLNIFSIGINISLLICFFVVYVSFDLIIENGNILFKELIHFMDALHL